MCIISNTHGNPDDLYIGPNTNLSYMDLTDYIFIGENLTKANFTHSIMAAGSLQRAILKEVIFKKTYLQWANLSKADLRGANFTGAKMKHTKLNKAQVENAIFTNAKGLHRTQKEYLRKHGAIDVPKDSDDDLYEFRVHPFTRWFRYFKKTLSKFLWEENIDV